MHTTQFTTSTCDASFRAHMPPFSSPRLSASTAWCNRMSSFALRGTGTLLATTLRPRAWSIAPTRGTPTRRPRVATTECRTGRAEWQGRRAYCDSTDSAFCWLSKVRHCKLITHHQSATERWGRNAHRFCTKHRPVKFWGRNASSSALTLSFTFNPEGGAAARAHADSGGAVRLSGGALSRLVSGRDEQGSRPGARVAR
eukprot:COSAG02_NODE_1629_length_11581_cov_5.858735_10_plen_199_part_00